MRVTPNLSLTVWDSNNDEFNPTELADNWDKIDDAFDTSISFYPADRVEIRADLPVSSLFNGRLVYLTAAVGGFQANTMVVYTGSAWRNVGPFEKFSALPTTGNFIGRIIALTSADGGFAANDVVINTNGSTSWTKVGGVANGATLPGSPSAGDMFLLTGADGGFDAYSFVAYNGSAWQRLEKRGVEVGSSLPGAPYQGQLFVLTSEDAGFITNDLVQYTGSAWRLLTGPQYITTTDFIALTSVPNGYEVYLRIDDGDGVLWHLRYNGASSSPYKWEAIGANSLLTEVATYEGPPVKNTWTDVATVGPEWDVPSGLSGDFYFSAMATQNPNTRVAWKIGVSINDATPVDQLISNHHGQDTDKHSLVLQTRKVTDLTAGDNVKLKYWIKKVEPTIGDRLLTITPVRIGVV